MDLFKGLLFLDGQVGAIKAEEFAEQFGSAAAANQMFAERWAGLDDPLGQVTEADAECLVGCG